MLRPGKAADATPREAAIILTLVNHPALAENRMEALAALEFSTPSARALMAALLDILAHDHDITPENLAQALSQRGFGDSIDKMRQALHRQGVWQAGEGVAQLDAETGLTHALALHYKSVELNRALKAAETALDVDWTEETFERLQDIKNQITTVDGTEALIEGFGSLSGRATRGF
jgi:DNA primase